jgi:nucleoside transporter
MSAKLSWSVRWRLSVLWVLEWGITGAILTYLPIYFTEHKLEVSELGQLMAVSAVGLLVAPFIVGQVCDRWMSSERYMAIAQAAGGFLLLSIPSATEHYRDTREGFGGLLLLIGLYAVAYFPTIPLASSLTFRHLPDRDRQFGGIRIWGTIGWVAAGLSLSFWLGRNDGWVEWLDWGDVDGIFREPLSKDAFYMAAALSFALCGFSFFLPPTPPERSPTDGVAPLEVLRMFRNPTFSVLIGISFLLALVIPLYSLAVPMLIDKMLWDMQVSDHWVPAVMTVGQISEFPALLLLPFCLKRFGMKATFALGMLAWVIRYGMFAFVEPVWLILIGISFHGVCHVFLVIVIQLYVDAVCRADLRASAQNLFAFITMGIGMPAGFVLSGLWGDYCRIKDFDAGNFPLFFSVPAGLILLLLAVYWRYFAWPSPAQPETSAE